MQIGRYFIVISLLAACGSGDDGGGADAKDGLASYTLKVEDGGGDAMKPPQDVSTDLVNPMADASTGTKGCTSAADQAFLPTLPVDATAAAQFAALVRNCTLPNVNLPADATTLGVIGNCVAAGGKTVSATCGGCFGLEVHCSFLNCVANFQEAAVANCPADPTSTTCIDCAKKHGCTTAAATCKAGK